MGECWITLITPRENEKNKNKKTPKTSLILHLKSQPWKIYWSLFHQSTVYLWMHKSSQCDITIHEHLKTKRELHGMKKKGEIRKEKEKKRAYRAGVQAAALSPGKAKQDGLSSWYAPDISPSLFSFQYAPSARILRHADRRTRQSGSVNVLGARWETIRGNGGQWWRGR